MFVCRQSVGIQLAKAAFNYMCVSCMKSNFFACTKSLWVFINVVLLSLTTTIPVNLSIS